MNNEHVLCSWHKNHSEDSVYNDLERHQQNHLPSQWAHRQARQQEIHPCSVPAGKMRGTCWYPSPADGLSPFQLPVGHLQCSYISFFLLAALWVKVTLTLSLKRCTLKPQQPIVSNFKVSAHNIGKHMAVSRSKLSQLPVIILTFTPRSRARRIVSALSWRGGSKRGNNPQNSQGPPALSLLWSGTSCIVDSSPWFKSGPQLLIPRRIAQVVKASFLQSQELFTLGFQCSKRVFVFIIILDGDCLFSICILRMETSGTAKTAICADPRLQNCGIEMDILCCEEEHSGN